MMNPGRSSVRWALCLLGSLAVLAGVAIGAAPPHRLQYSSRLWQLEGGLPDNSVRALVQTRDGYLWVGTQKGLARFDGVHFSFLKPVAAPELGEANILGLLESQDGSLWIATGHNGVFRLKDGQCVHYGKTERLATEFCLGLLFESRDGSVWVGTTEGLSRFQQGKFTNLGLDHGLSSGVVKGMCEDQEGNLWFATTSGVNCWRAGAVVSRLTTPDRLSRKDVRTICCEANGTLWLGTGDGLSRVQNGEVTTFTKKNGLAYDIITKVYLDRRGNLWVGTYTGLSRFVEGRFVEEFDSAGQSFDYVNTLFEDREGNLWVGSRDGLTRLRPRSITAYTQQEGLTYNNVMSVLEDRDGALWLGTWGGGLNRWKDGTLSACANLQPMPAQVLGLCLDHAGQLWAGTDFDGGLFRFRDGTPHQYTAQAGLPGTAIRVVYEDRQARLWVGTRSGLYRADGERFELFEAEDGPVRSDVRCLGEDRAGHLWVGTEEGLIRLQDRTATRFTAATGWSHQAVIALYADVQTNLWIGTAGGGLVRFQDEQFTTYTRAQGLFSDIVCEILEDDHGWLWMSCQRGIFRVSRRNLDRLDVGKAASLNSIAYGREDGLRSELCNSVAKPAAWKSRDGRLWFATTRGVCVVEPGAELRTEEAPPPVYIEQVRADKKPVGAPGTDFGCGPFSSGASPGRPLRVAPGRGELEFQYTALSYRAPEKNRFRYKLQGVDAEWVEAGTRRAAYYNNLYPGHYRFQVLACNSDGEWNQAGAGVEVVLLPHFWQTWWFLAGCVLTVVAGGGGLIRRVEQRKAQRALERLERSYAIDRERVRIARDMHDEIGSKLSRISFLSDMAGRGLPADSVSSRQVEQVSEAAREVIQTVDEIVWAVSPQNDTAESLVHYICRQAEAFFELTPIELEIQLPVELPAHQFSAEVRHNLFCAVKEVLNNVLKHAAATRVRLAFAVSPAAFQLTIADNGRGFAPASTPPATGPGRPLEAVRPKTGIAGIRVRLKSVQGDCELQSQPGQGTTWRLTLPLQPG